MTISFTQKTGAQNPFSSIPVGTVLGGMGLGDLNGDGKPDLLIYQGSGSTNGNAPTYYVNNGSGVFTQQTAPSGLSTLIAPVINIVDLDGDGLNDLLLTSQEFRTIRYFKNTGTATVPAFTEQTGANNPFSTTFGNRVATGIYRKNGLVNVIEAEQTNNRKPRYYENTGTPTSPQFTERTGTTIGAADYNPFDITGPWNSNGLKHVTTGTFTDTDGSTITFALQGSDVNSGSTADPIKVAKLNNDGSFTVVTGTAQDPLTGYLPGKYLTRIQVADVNGDGKPDIATMDYYNSISYFENTTPLVSNQPPVITTSGTALSFTEGDSATVVDADLALTDADSANIASASVQITDNYVNGEDVLAFINQNGITGSFDALTGTLTLTGSSSVANYQAALRSVTYVNSSATPSTLARTISFIANDGTAASTAATRTVNIIAVNNLVSSPTYSNSETMQQSSALIDAGPAYSSSDTLAQSSTEFASSAVYSSSAVLSQSSAVLDSSPAYSSSDTLAQSSTEFASSPVYSSSALLSQGSAVLDSSPASSDTLAQSSTEFASSAVYSSSALLSQSSAVLDSSPVYSSSETLVQSSTEFASSPVYSSSAVLSQGSAVLDSSPAYSSSDTLAESSAEFTSSPVYGSSAVLSQGSAGLDSSPTYSSSDTLTQSSTEFTSSPVYSSSAIVNESSASSSSNSLSSNAETVSASSFGVSSSLVNQAPLLLQNSIRINQGETLLITADQLSAIDLDTANSGLLFTVSNVSHAEFRLNGMATTQFTQQDIIDGRVELVHDNSKQAPGFTVSVSDGINSTLPVTAQIQFIRVNHAPVLVNAVPDQQVKFNQPFNLTLAEDTFQDPDGDELSYSMLTADNKTLPEWITFNSERLELSGKASVAGNNRFRLFATDTFNVTTQTSVNLQVQDASSRVLTGGAIAGITVGAAAAVGIGSALGIGLFAGAACLLYKGYNKANEPKPKIDLELIEAANTQELNI